MPDFAGPPPAEPPRLNIRFLYAMCDDIAAVRAFYTGLLGMEETQHMDSEQWGWLVYRSEGFSLMFFRWDSPLPMPEDWCWQPGNGEGHRPAMSFSVQVPWADFPGLVARVQASPTRTQAPAPTWRQASYWGFTVMDPAGHTVELYADPPEKPAGEAPTWPDDGGGA